MSSGPSPRKRPSSSHSRRRSRRSRDRAHRRPSFSRLPLHNEYRSSHSPVLGGNEPATVPHPMGHAKMGKLVRVNTAGESGRVGVNPLLFLEICFKSTTPMSMIVNVLWPFVPVAIVMHFARPDLHLWNFILSYIAMVPAANILGFAGGELAKKLPKVIGVLVETTLSSVVELVMFMILIHNDEDGNLIPVIQAAILGSIMANLLLCLGLCFFIGGMKREEQVFHNVISETGSGLMLVAGFGLLIPSAFYSALSGSTNSSGKFTPELLVRNTLRISRATAIILICAFLMWSWFNLRTHHSLYDEVLEADEANDEHAHREEMRKKLTMSECFVAVALSLTAVAMCAVFLVQEIEHIVERGVPDNFLGFILVPLVEKAAEHLVAVDEAWDNKINSALFHCLAPSIQTSLFNGPLVVIAGWGLHKSMDLNFEIFMSVVMLLSILVVGSFLRDGRSTYLEGGLLVMVYVIIAVTTFYYPNPSDGRTNIEVPSTNGHGAD